MTSFDDVAQTVLRNMLLGRWAAEKMGMNGREADDYSDALARSTFDPARSDVFDKIRKDFDAAGVAQSDEQILRVMNDLMLRAGERIPTAQGHSTDAAAVMLARNLRSR